MIGLALIAQTSHVGRQILKFFGVGLFWFARLSASLGLTFSFQALQNFFRDRIDRYKRTGFGQLKLKLKLDIATCRASHNMPKIPACNKLYFMQRTNGNVGGIIGSFSRYCFFAVSVLPIRQHRGEYSRTPMRCNKPEGYSRLHDHQSAL